MAYYLRVIFIDGWKVFPRMLVNPFSPKVNPVSTSLTLGRLFRAYYYLLALIYYDVLTVQGWTRTERAEQAERFTYVSRWATLLPTGGEQRQQSYLLRISPCQPLSWGELKCRRPNFFSEAARTEGMYLGRLAELF